MSGSLQLRPNTVVVFEGLDATGKTTQHQLLQNSTLSGGADFLHMPSGVSPFSTLIRDALESDDVRPRSPLATQLAHLASHAEALESLRSANVGRSLVLDRWWWSLIAYGWKGAGLQDSEGIDALPDLVRGIWDEVRPDVLFLFLEPFEIDSHNTQVVEDAYRELSASILDVVPIHRASRETTHEFIIRALRDRGLAL